MAEQCRRLHRRLVQLGAQSGTGSPWRCATAGNGSIVGALGLVILLLLFAAVSRKLTFSRNLVASALFLAIVFVLLPRIVFGSAYADMRLAPYVFAIALVAIRFPRAGDAPLLADPRHRRPRLLPASAPAAPRLSMWLYDRAYDRELAALDHVPHGARLVSFVGRDCVEPWAMTRLLHLPGLAIVRRHAFSNDQWTMAGAQLLQVRYKPGWPLHPRSDPGRHPRPLPRARSGGRSSQALAFFPRDAFDYVWLISPPPYDAGADRGACSPIWRSGSSVLYRVDGSQPAAAQGPSMTAPSLSIVVPCYNEEACLAELHAPARPARRARSPARIMRSC